MYQSYHGESHDNLLVDQVLRSYFPNFSYKGVFFDVGAFEPITISNSYHFEMNDWDVYCFEANSELIPNLKNKRKNVFHYAIGDTNLDKITFNVVHTKPNWAASFSAINIDSKYKDIFGWNNRWTQKQIEVQQKTLNYIIENEIQICKIDILSIDVEGGELNVLKGLDIRKYSPKIILVENVSDDIVLDNYIKSFDYKLDKKYAYNYFYIYQ